MTDELFAVTEVASRLEITPATMRRLCHGKLRGGYLTVGTIRFNVTGTTLRHVIDAGVPGAFHV